MAEIDRRTIDAAKIAVDLGNKFQAKVEKGISDTLDMLKTGASGTNPLLGMLALKNATATLMLGSAFFWRLAQDEDATEATDDDILFVALIMVLNINDEKLSPYEIEAKAAQWFTAITGREPPRLNRLSIQNMAPDATEALEKGAAEVFGRS